MTAEPGRQRSSPASMSAGPGPRRSLPPRLLDPILALAERVDTRRRGIRPIRADGVLAIERTRWRGADVRLDDGTLVGHGDRIGEMHFRSERARSVGRRGWQTAGLREGRADLRALAAWAAAQPTALRPVAYHGLTIHAAFPRREGWQVRARERTFWARLDAWYMRWLLSHWALDGRARLGRGHGALESVEIWLSAAGLQARYGQLGPLAPASPVVIGPATGATSADPASGRSAPASVEAATAAGPRPGPGPRARGRPSGPPPR